ncbi:MAG: dipeptide epimerase [Cytophagaceae bacterium]|jgi:L-alanine-DL-glutamate epimerase-like enolase superfamily enzyme|nr:dipeptide epimerase [Cytophagaceae bacterium]
MQLRFFPYELKLKHAFNLASSSRTSTPVVITELTSDGITGYGEASMPPYLGESHASALDFLSKVNLSSVKNPFLIEDILEYVDSIAPANYAAKASIDIALHDLTGKLAALPCYKMWGLNRDKTPHTSFTIGIDTPETVKQKTEDASPYTILKIKLGRDNDRQLIEAIRSVTAKPLSVDVNQGWTDKYYALDMILWLKEQNVLFVEQPLPKKLMNDAAWLKQYSPLPIIADEAVQTAKDIPLINDVYHGINIKLMKCGGMRAARNMVAVARSIGLKVMIGCMTETSCAVSAAAQLSPLCDWADLDGNLLITNDLFQGVEIINGKITLQDSAGIGVRRVENYELKIANYEK